MATSPRLRTRTLRLAVVGVAALALGTATACSDTTSGAAPAPSASADGATVAVPVGATIVDVRTPAEFAGGHLEGAVNIDVQAPDFDARIAELDPEGSYLVYCRSGNRSAAAVAAMRTAGFTDLTDLGALDEASASTGVPVVR